MSTSVTRYFKRAIESDDILPRPSSWGRSAIYYETTEEGFAIRQIQLFQSGIVLAYDSEHHHDDYGWLDGNPICSDPPVTGSISSKDFHRAWMRHDEAQNHSNIAERTPNSRPPRQLPTSPKIQSSDSQRTPSSGGCG
jgi:hypothetical protein